MLLTLDESSPKADQILEQARAHIASGALRTGERLPSTRMLAQQLGVHRSTVAKAYQELWAQGWIDLHSGACPCVRSRVHGTKSSSEPAPSGFDWAQASSRASRAVFETHGRLHPPAPIQDCISFANLSPDPRLMPADAFRSCLNRVLRLRGPRLLGYGERMGYRPLREYLARRMKQHGISATADQILITNGSQHALDLVFRLVSEPGRRVAVETPTYGYALPLIRLLGMEPLGIPVGPQGMDLDDLEGRFQNQRPALVYTMPNFQNPTGACTSQAHREALLALCERYGVPILEDAFEEEMKYFGKVTQPIKSMDQKGLVVYCGTFSKVLFPGTRIGWVLADTSCIERLTALRRFTDLCPPTPLQAAMHDFCEKGHYDLHLSRMHRVFRKRMQSALRALREHIDPATASWHEPHGGFLIWMSLKRPAPAGTDWWHHLVSKGVQVSWGNDSFTSAPEGCHLRLSISTLDETQITEGIRRLGQALKG